MLNVPSLNGLRVFEAAGRHLNFRRAAEELCVTQSAVSQQITTLEAQIGVKLFLRTAKGVLLTEPGADYLSSVQSALNSISEATHNLCNSRGDSLTVSVMPTFTVNWLMPRLFRFRELWPMTELKLVVSVDQAGVIASGADAAIWHGLGPWPGVITHRLFSHHDLLPVCSPGLVSGPFPLNGPEDLVHHTLLRAKREIDDWDVWLESAKIMGVELSAGPLFEANSIAIQAAIEGLGVAIGREPFISEYLATGRLIAPFDIRARSESTYHLAYSPMVKQTPAVKGFRDWLLSELRVGGPWGKADPVHMSRG